MDLERDTKNPFVVSLSNHAFRAVFQMSETSLLSSRAQRGICYWREKQIPRCARDDILMIQRRLPEQAIQIQKH